MSPVKRRAAHLNSRWPHICKQSVYCCMPLWLCSCHCYILLQPQTPDIIALTHHLEEVIATPLVFLPKISHGWRSQVGYSSWGQKELDTTEHACRYNHWKLPVISKRCIIISSRQTRKLRHSKTKWFLQNHKYTKTKTFRSLSPGFSLRHCRWIGRKQHIIHIFKIHVNADWLSRLKFWTSQEGVRGLCVDVSVNTWRLSIFQKI